MPICIEVYGWLSMAFYLVPASIFTPIKDKGFSLQIGAYICVVVSETPQLTTPLPQPNFLLISPFSKLYP